MAVVKSPYVQLVAKASSKITGTTRYAADLYRGLGAIDVDAALTFPPSLALPACMGGRWPTWNARLRAFFSTYPLRTSLLESASVYHMTVQTLATLLWAQRFPGPVVVSVLDIIPYLTRRDQGKARAQHVADKVFYRLALAGLRKADAIVAISAHTFRTLVEALRIAPERIYVVHPGLDHSKFRSLTIPEHFRTRYGLAEGGQYILYVGSDDPRKNLPTVVRALASIKRHIPGVKLLKVGAAHFVDARAGLLALTETLGLQDDVVFFDHVPDDVLPFFYNVADVLVMPSLHEGFGLPVVEAMACGTPVLCADIDVFREVAGEAALFVPPQDVSAWAEALMMVFEHGAKGERLREAGEQRAQDFTLELSAQMMLEVYQQGIASWRS